MNKHFILVLPILLLSACSAIMTRDDGNGGRIEDVYSSRDYTRVLNKAQTYCQQRNVGVANITLTNTGCLLCESKYDIYEFSCGNAAFAGNQQNFVQECAEKGLKIDSKAHTQCVAKMEKAEQARIEKEQKIATARAEKETREQAKREREYAAKMQQEKINADKAKCDAYGIKRGTSAFATCLMQIDQMKQQQQMQQQMLQAQEQQAALQRQAAQEQANAQQQRDKAAYFACLGQPTTNGDSFTRCAQNPNSRPVQTTCTPDVHGNLNCISR